LATALALLVAAPAAAQAEGGAAEDRPAAPRDAPGDDARGEARAAAVPPAPATDRRRVAVLLLPAGDLEAEITDGLAELLIGGVAARGGVTLVGKEELQAQLGQGDAGTLACIGSTACLGRLGVELDLVEVIAGTLARRGETWVFDLARVDVRSGQTLGRVFREVEGDLGAVADALAESLPALHEPPRAPATLVLATVSGAEVALDGALVGTAADGRLRLEGVAPGAHQVRVTAPGRGAWRRVVRLAPGAEVHLEAHLPWRARPRETVNPLVWIGGGVALGALAGALALGVASQASLEPSRQGRLEGEVTRAEVVGFYDAREREAVAANALFGLAGAAAIAGAVALFFPLVDERADDLSLIPVPGGLVLRGGF
jgi:hypothetical protein